MTSGQFEIQLIAVVVASFYSLNQVIAEIANSSVEGNAHCEEPENKA